MRGRRAEIQRQLAEAHISEVKELIWKMRAAVVVSEVLMKDTASIDVNTMNKAIRNLEDLAERFLEGQLEGGQPICIRR